MRHSSGNIGECLLDSVRNDSELLVVASGSAQLHEELVAARRHMVREVTWFGEEEM